MPHKPAPAEASEAFGSDSFLDIVANMVGILIILVMVAGLRVKHAADEPIAGPPTPPIDTAPLEAEAASLRADVETVYAKAKQLSDLAVQRSQERDALALLVAAHKNELDERQATLASEERESFDLERTLEAERVRLAGLERDLGSAAVQPERESIKIKTYPTPISRTVHGRESHFQIKDNRVTYVPLEELVDTVKREVQNKFYRMRDLDEFTETVGPIGGFRLRYTMSRIRNAPGSSMPGTMVGVTELELLPITSQLGETWAEAAQPGSTFQRTIGDLDARRVTITLWTYPESFATYRTIREHLYERGYAVAGRPLPHGKLISGSPFGSKSAAQ